MVSIILVLLGVYSILGDRTNCLDSENQNTIDNSLRGR